MLDQAAEVFYRRLMSVVDDFGRYDARPAVLKSMCFPLRADKVREADISRWLAICEKAGLILLYESGGRPYLELHNLGEPRAKRSKWPDPPACAQMKSDASTCAQTQTYVPGPPPSSLPASSPEVSLSHTLSLPTPFSTPPLQPPPRGRVVMHTAKGLELAPPEDAIDQQITAYFSENSMLIYSPRAHADLKAMARGAAWEDVKSAVDAAVASGASSPTSYAKQVLSARQAKSRIDSEKSLPGDDKRKAVRKAISEALARKGATK
jgi:hypothetical protein